MQLAVCFPLFVLPRGAGKIRRVCVEAGADVDAGTPLVELDLQGVVVALCAESPGRVSEIRVREGETIAPGRRALWMEATGAPSPAAFQVAPARKALPQFEKFSVPEIGIPVRSARIVSVEVSVGSHVDVRLPIAYAMSGPIRFPIFSPRSGTVMAMAFAIHDLISPGDPLLQLDGAPDAARQSSTPAVARTPTAKLQSRTLGEFQRHAASLRQVAVDLMRLQEQLGLRSGMERLTFETQHITDNRFVVAAVGEFKRGKSTFLNALLGSRILPADVLPCSAVPVRISYGEVFQAEAIFRDRRRQMVPQSELANFVTKLTRQAEKNAQELSEVHLHLPSPMLRHFDLLDTPGLSDESRMSEITVSVLGQVDAALFVMKAGGGVFADSERRFVAESLVSSTGIGRILFVLNGMDLEPIAEDRRRLIEDTEKRIATTLDAALAVHLKDPEKLRGAREKLKNFKLYPLSAKMELEGASDSGFSALRTDLEDVVARERGSLMLNRYLDCIAEEMSDAGTVIALRRLRETHTRQEFETRVNAYVDGISTARRQAAKFSGRLYEELAKVEQKVRPLVVRFRNDLIARSAAVSERFDFEGMLKSENIAKVTSDYASELGVALDQCSSAMFRDLTSILRDSYDAMASGMNFDLAELTATTDLGSFKTRITDKVWFQPFSQDTWKRVFTEQHGADTVAVELLDRSRIRLSPDWTAHLLSWVAEWDSWRVDAAKKLRSRCHEQTVRRLEQNASQDVMEGLLCRYTRLPLLQLFKDYNEAIDSIGRDIVTQLDDLRKSDATAASHEETLRLELDLGKMGLSLAGVAGAS